MFTPASRHSANSYRLAGSGRSRGRSSCSNNARRETPSLRIGRALGDEHVRLDDGFVARVAGARGDDGGAVVLGELEIGAIDDGLVATRLGDAAAEVIGDKDRR